MDKIIPKNDKLIIFSDTWIGDNVNYLFDYLREDPDYDVLWLAREPKIEKKLLEKYHTSEVISLTSLKGLWYFSRAKISVYGHGFWDYLNFLQEGSPKIILNVWHGIPIKGVKIDYQNMDDDEKQQNNHLTLVNSFFDQQYFQERYQEGIDGTRMVGYPRNQYIHEIITNDNEMDKLREDIISEIPTDPNYVILYAPTFREQTSTELFPFDDFDTEELIEFCDENEILFLIRPHPRENEILKASEYKELFDSDYFIKADKSRFAETQDLLLIADLLITDYSSLVFDYFITQRPVLFIPYDLERYKKERDMPQMYQELAQRGSVDNLDELLVSIEDALIQDKESYRSRALTNFEKYHDYRIDEVIPNIKQLLEDELSNYDLLDS